MQGALGIGFRQIILIEVNRFGRRLDIGRRRVAGLNRAGDLVLQVIGLHPFRVQDTETVIAELADRLRADLIGLQQVQQAVGNLRRSLGIIDIRQAIKVEQGQGQALGGRGLPGRQRDHVLHIDKIRATIITQ